MTSIEPEIFDYIDAHLEDDVAELALKKNPYPTYDWKWILNQIAAKKKAKTKLPTWFTTPRIIYPNLISIEQTSSEELARFKAQLFSGSRFIDLTGGFGVDTYYFAQQFSQAVHCEYQEDLARIVKHNYKQLGVNNVTFVVGDSLSFLEKSESTFDLIYVDPARRNASQKKVFLFEDCQPDVPVHLNLLFEKSPIVVVKSSPLVDLQQGVNQLKYVRKIYIISLKNDVKELLWILQKNVTSPIEIEAVCIDQEVVRFHHIWQDDSDALYCEPKQYLYEPFHAVMKTGLFHTIGNKYGMYKLHPHSHLYTSDELVVFPGRRFRITHQFPYQKKELKEYVFQQKMHVTTRNFPLSVEEIRKKHKIKEGGELYAFFTTNKSQEKIVLVCEKV